MKVALISDTHVPPTPELPGQLLDHLARVDLILHAGDLVCLHVLESLEEIGETLAVHGNSDEPAVVERLPRKRLLSVAGRSVGLIHGNQASEIEREYLKPDHDYESPPVEAFYRYLLEEFPAADVVVFGHFHVPVVMQKHGRLLINPGSVAAHNGRSSLVILEIECSGEKAEIVELSSSPACSDIRE